MPSLGSCPARPARSTAGAHDAIATNDAGFSRVAHSASPVQAAQRSAAARVQGAGELFVP
jgi:hypothetical protein